MNHLLNHSFKHSLKQLVITVTICIALAGILGVRAVSHPVLQLSYSEVKLFETEEKETFNPEAASLLSDQSVFPSETAVSVVEIYDPELAVYYDLNAFNQLPEEMLCHFKGIGEATASAIIGYREAHGGFKSFEELIEVPGIGEKKLASIFEKPDEPTE